MGQTWIYLAGIKELVERHVQGVRNRLEHAVTLLAADGIERLGILILRNVLQRLLVGAGQLSAFVAVGYIVIPGVVFGHALSLLTNDGESASWRGWD